MAASEIGLQDKFPPNLHCPLVAMHHPCALAGPVGTGAEDVGALAGELTCLGESATPLPGEPPLPFPPNQLVLMWSVFLYLRHRVTTALE